MLCRIQPSSSMEVLSASHPKIPFSLSQTSPFSLRFPVTAWCQRTPFRYSILTSKLHKNPSFAIYLPSRSSRNFQVLAHFGRRKRRRNSLRKKLIDYEQVRHNPITCEPDSDSRSVNDSGILKDDVNINGAKESGVNHGGVVRVENSGLEEFKLKRFSESMLWNKLSNWIDQYKKDVEDWGIGSSPIFTVFEDLEGNVKRVSVDEHEIFRRSRVNRRRSEDSVEVNLKILCAESLAREMESGKNVIPRNSTVAKFLVQGVESSGFGKEFHGFSLPPELLPRLPMVGSTMLFGFVVLWVVKKLFTFGAKEVHHTGAEKEMVRKKKSIKEKEMVGIASVEVVRETVEPPISFIEKPKLDKEELMDRILKAKACTGKSSLEHSSGALTAKSSNSDGKVQEIRQQAVHAQESEADRDGKERQVVFNELSSETEQVNKHSEEDDRSVTNPLNGDSGQTHDIYGNTKMRTLEEPGFGDNGFLSMGRSIEDRDMRDGRTLSGKVSDRRQSSMQDCKDSKSATQLTDTKEVAQPSDTSDSESCMSKENSIRTKPRVILSVKEARDYLSEKHGDEKVSIKSIVKIVQETAAVFRLPSEEGVGSSASHKLQVHDNVAAISGQTSSPTPSTKACEGSPEDSFLTSNGDSKGSALACGVADIQKAQTSLNHESNDINREAGLSKKNWIETNFHEVEPIVKKIGMGFKDNYTVAREKVNEQLNANTEITQLGFSEDDSEFEWIKDDKLREIVFQVRENELAGRDPFHLMDAEDKHAFFGGLEKKVEKENEKLLKVHEWLHSNIENLDYGADGISLYDPPEKIIPRWKVAPVEKSPEFLNNFLEQRKSFLAESTGDSYSMKNDQEFSVQKTTESTNAENFGASLPALHPNKKFHGEDPKNSKIVVEGSDGSVKAGTKSGKEYWQHTKKWSRGFLESYNAEEDPEVKATMKDIGKDLDRWITEKEIQETAELMTKLPERNKKFMEKKLNKIKREMELFGPQAVVSKYREYTDEQEEDYLWWLDIPHVLCIELYTVDNGEERVGFYSLEMDTDLELEPKPCHVIAFEDVGDCKNMCYIIQAHMEMLGNGRAFVVPRPPKDAFRDAKGNGFGVTVIRKGELQLNVDQTLEQVEEQLTEIGSKIYHDMIMKERSVDISSLMKGVFGTTGKRTKRKGLRRMRKNSKK